MKSDFKKLSFKKLTIARIDVNKLKSIQGGSSAPTDPDTDIDHNLSMEIEGCTYSHLL